MNYQEAIRNIFQRPSLTQADRDLYPQLARQPDKLLRLDGQLRRLDQIIDIASSLGLRDSLFGLGGVVYPQIRNTRIHGDVDLCVRGKSEYDTLLRHLLEQGNFHESREQLLAGSSMKYIQHDTDTRAGVIEMRYVTSVQASGVKVWKHDVPSWVKPILGFRDIIIPDSAFSGPDEKTRIIEHDVRFVRPEYALLIKRKSPYLKDQFDYEKLLKDADPFVLDTIWKDAQQSGGILILPYVLITLIRSMECLHKQGDPAFDTLLNHIPQYTNAQGLRV